MQRKCTYVHTEDCFVLVSSLTHFVADNESLLHLYIVYTYIYRERGWLTDSKSQRKEKRRFVGRMNKIVCDFENWSEDSASRCSNCRRQQLMFQIKEEKRVSYSSAPLTMVDYVGGNVKQRVILYICT